MLIVESKEKLVMEDNKQIKYIYRVVKSSICISNNDDEKIQSYGIEIERQDIIEGEVTNIEREAVKHISPQRHKVQMLMEELCEYVLSPLHLNEVVDERIESYICDFCNLEKNRLSC